jgi:hypothetical protein
MFCTITQLCAQHSRCPPGDALLSLCRMSSLVPALLGARWPKATDSDAFTEAGRRLGSSEPRRSEPPWPPLPLGALGRPMDLRLAAMSSSTFLGMRGKMVSK